MITYTPAQSVADMLKGSDRMTHTITRQVSAPQWSVVEYNSQDRTGKIDGIVAIVYDHPNGKMITNHIFHRHAATFDMLVFAMQADPANGWLLACNL